MIFGLFLLLQTGNVDLRRTALKSTTPSDEIVRLDIDHDSQPDILERWWNGKRVRMTYRSWQKLSERELMPRGLILPPEAPEEAQEWWIDTMQEVVETPEWQDYLDENYLLKDEKWGEDFTSYLNDTQASFEEQLTELGAL